MFATPVAAIPQSLIRWEISNAKYHFARQETIYETRSKTLLNYRWYAHCYV
jgi:hypothetical protein